MKISSTIKPQIKTQKTPAPDSKTSAPAEGSFGDEFLSSAKAELPKALAYSTLAGATAGIAGHVMSQASLMGAGSSLGLGAAAGAALGIVVGVGVSIFQALNPEAAAQPAPVKSQPETPRTEPTPAKPPAPTAGEVFTQDALKTGKKIDQRVLNMESLLKAEKLQLKTVGRQGAREASEVNKFLQKAEASHKKSSSSRPAVAKAEGNIDALKSQLAKLKNQQQRVMRMQVDIQAIREETLDRGAYYSAPRADGLEKDIATEMARIQQSLKA